MRKSLLYAVAALALATASSAADSPYKPGKWRVTVQMEMPGMPVKIPPISHEMCITEEEAKDPQKSVPNDPKSQCKVGDYKVDGKTISWTVDCPKQNTTGEGHITFDGDSYTGGMKMKVGDQEMSQKYTGKWLGACEK